MLLELISFRELLGLKLLITKRRNLVSWTKYNWNEKKSLKWRILQVHSLHVFCPVKQVLNFDFIHYVSE